jgi:hypothetical protein
MTRRFVVCKYYSDDEIMKKIWTGHVECKGERCMQVSDKEI